MRWAFFFAVDDGGFSHLYPDGLGPHIEFSAYENLLTLAQEFGLTVPVAVTAKFIDFSNISGIAECHRDSEALIGLLKKHPEHIEPAHHGVTHKMGDSYYEFFNPRSGLARPEQEQTRIAQVSSKIWRAAGLPSPQTLVPPAHGWEPGVTDKVFAAQGVKYLISLRHEKVPLEDVRAGSLLNFGRALRPVFSWSHSDYLEFLPRASMGISSHHFAISPLRASLVRHLVKPYRNAGQRLLQRTWRPRVPHSYMTHIGNFMGPDNLRFWREFLSWVQKHPRLQLAHNNAEAIALWREASAIESGQMDH